MWLPYVVREVAGAVPFCEPAVLCFVRERATLFRFESDGTNSTRSLQPTAAAYSFSEVSDGTCFSAASRRDIALFVVPMRAATTSCVRPARKRAQPSHYALRIWSISFSN